MADQAINALSTKTAPETSDQLLLVGAGEPQLIDYDKLADAILNKITSKNYALDAGTMTLTAALNALNGKSCIYTPTISIDMKEYIKTLSEGMTHYFRTQPGNIGNPTKNASFFFIIYIINGRRDGVGIAFGHSSETYYVRFSGGEIAYDQIVFK